MVTKSRWDNTIRAHGMATNSRLSDGRYIEAENTSRQNMNFDLPFLMRSALFFLTTAYSSQPGNTICIKTSIFIFTLQLTNLGSLSPRSSFSTTMAEASTLSAEFLATLTAACVASGVLGRYSRKANGADGTKAHNSADGTKAHNSADGTDANCADGTKASSADGTKANSADGNSADGTEDDVDSALLFHHY